ncbi:hypothetical protein IGI04_001280 [Brassica rapa subsp. trilocularis]|uniref:DUF4378 domain-containing protein n=1 Tax=Brassica rapa subsp. trilocularis TaxID=1813537 RepID=A0ABQ7NSG1_BRACM|nr:hypothetical protein IGI04_001280 [Brassica rapa subsp. trilocularis]
MASSITSFDHHLPMSKRRLKSLSLRDYLLDDLSSSCSSNGFKSLPRLLDAEIKRSGILHRKRRSNCGLAFSHAVKKASTALLGAVKLLPFPSSSVKPPSPSRKKGMFSWSFSRNLWKKLSHREVNNVDDGEIERRTEGREQKIQRGRSLTFGEFLKESLDQPSNASFSGEATLSNSTGCDSTSVGSELFMNSEVTQSSGESETWKQNDAVGDGMEETRNRVVVMMSGDSVGSLVSDRSSVNDNREKLLRKSRRFETLVRLVPVDLEKRIEQYVERQDYDSHPMVQTEENQSENRATRLFALLKSRLTEEPSQLLASQKVDSLLLDFFREDGNTDTRDEHKLVKIVEEWLMRRQEEEYMFMSWEVEEKREIYVKEMKWGFINGDEQDYVVEELGNGFVTSLIDELILDLSL